MDTINLKYRFFGKNMGDCITKVSIFLSAMNFFLIELLLIPTLFVPLDE